MADYTLSAKITGDASKFQKAMQQAEASMQKLNQKFGSFGGALETLGGKMTSAGTKITALEAAAGGAAVALGTQAVKAGASFEAEMSKVRNFRQYRQRFESPHRQSQGNGQENEVFRHRIRRSF